MTPKPDPNTFDARLDKVMRKQASIFTDALTPFLLETLQALLPDKSNFDLYYKSAVGQVTASLTGMVVSSALNIAQDRALGKKLAILMVAEVGRKTIRYLEDLEKGLQSPVRSTEYDVRTGQPVPFDFRNHLTPAKPDSGRASDIGG